MDSPDDGLIRLGGAANDLRYKLPRLDMGREAIPRSSTTTSPRSASATATFPGSSSWSTPGCDHLTADSERPPVPARVVPDALGAGRARRRLVRGGHRRWAETRRASAPTTRPRMPPIRCSDRARRCPVAGVGDDVLWPAVPLDLASGTEFGRRTGRSSPSTCRPPRTRCCWSSPSTTTAPRRARPSRGGRRTAALHGRRTGGRYRHPGRSRCCGTSSPAITR